MSFFFFFNDTATTEIYTLSLHDALPILQAGTEAAVGAAVRLAKEGGADMVKVLGDPGVVKAIVRDLQDRKSTRLNSSHLVISYAVFCLKKKKPKNKVVFNNSILH